MAVDEINAAGGFLGGKIEMTDMDTQTDPMTSRALMQKAMTRAPLQSWERSIQAPQS